MTLQQAQEKTLQIIANRTCGSCEKECVHAIARKAIEGEIEVEFALRQIVKRKCGFCDGRRLYADTHGQCAHYLARSALNIDVHSLFEQIAELSHRVEILENGRC